MVRGDDTWAWYLTMLWRAPAAPSAHEFRSALEAANECRLAEADAYALTCTPDRRMPGLCAHAAARGRAAGLARSDRAVQGFRGGGFRAGEGETKHLGETTIPSISVVRKRREALVASPVRPRIRGSLRIHRAGLNAAAGAHSAPWRATCPRRRDVASPRLKHRTMRDTSAHAQNSIPHSQPRRTARSIAAWM